ncbi:MAG: site-specific integrase [Pseudomonadota bacterium]
MARPSQPAAPQKRDGLWYLIRRVPAEFRDVDDRQIVRLSTGIRVADDPRGVLAAKKVQQLDQALWEFWATRRAGQAQDAETRYKAAVATARKLGFHYVPTRDLAMTMPVDDVVARLKTIEIRGSRNDEIEPAALMGTEEPPALTVSSLMGEFEAMNAAALTAKSPRQLHRWKVVRTTSIKTFLETLGSDKALSSLTRQDVLTFRQVMQDRVLAEEIEIQTANKVIGRVAGMFRAVCELHQLDVKPIFDRASLRGGEDRKRVAYPPKFVQDRFLAKDAFGDLNEEARRCIFLVIETGLRLSEACNLNDSTIILNHPTPHVLVRPDGREMKTQQSAREVPLVGVALSAMRMQPKGFPRYHDRGDSLSALVNKVLDTHGLRPVDGQSLYSLRHTFEDRLTAVEAPEKVVASLMGHKWYRPRYGEGPSLEQKANWMLKIAFTPPPEV